MQTKPKAVKSVNPSIQEQSLESARERILNHYNQLKKYAGKCVLEFLAMGDELRGIQDDADHGEFGAFLDTMPFSQATAYRAIAFSEKVAKSGIDKGKLLTVRNLKEATLVLGNMASGDSTSPAIASTPPTKEGSSQGNEWLAKVHKLVQQIIKIAIGHAGSMELRDELRPLIDLCESPNRNQRTQKTP